VPVADSFLLGGLVGAGAFLVGALVARIRFGTDGSDGAPADLGLD
jgi:hypothetical protein